LQFFGRDWLRFLFSGTTILGGGVFVAFRAGCLNSVSCSRWTKSTLLFTASLKLPSVTAPAFQVFGKHPIPFKCIPCYSFLVLLHLTPKGASTMEWVTPQHEEVDLNCEVSSYANAEL